MTDGAGALHPLYTRICRPTRADAAPVVIFNHGTPPRASERSNREPLRCDSEAARWFLDRGFMVVAGMRRGHGASGEVFAESSGACSAAEFAASGREASRDIEALVTYAAGLSYARSDRMVMVGLSTGGWSTIGYNAGPHPRVVAMVNMAGGRGGHFRGQVNNNCRPDQLALAAGILGRTASTPMLWIYSENDSYFGPELARAMWRDFHAAGGRGDFVMLPPFGADGHTLFLGQGGSAIWGPLVAAYLAERSITP
jgi:pimeloyl-ACP methyl ester carboxylesterase